jgi:chloramphenicol-sensitive protein RarD
VPSPAPLSLARIEGLPVVTAAGHPYRFPRCLLREMPHRKRQIGCYGADVPRNVSTIDDGPAGSVEARRGVIAGATAYAIWGLFPLYFHRLGQVRPVEIACLRILTTCLLVWVILGATRRARPALASVARPALLLRVALAGLMVTANWLIYVWAVSADHVVDAAICYFINPLVTVAMGVALLRERLRPLQKVALGFGALSVVVLTGAYGRFPWIALSLAATFALYGYLKKTAGLDAVPALAIETLCMAPIGLIGLVVIASRGGLDALSADAPTQGLLVALGAITALPLVLFGVAARRVPLSMLGLLQYLTPTMQLLCGVIALHEHVSAMRWVGMACVWVALAFLVRDTVAGSSRRVAIGTPLTAGGS